MAVPVIQSKVKEKLGSPESEIVIDPVPSGIVTGDVLIVALSIGTIRTVTAPSGFITIDLGGSDGDQSTHGAFYKIATSSEPTSYTFSWTGGNAKSIALMYRVDGAVSGDEIQDPDEFNQGDSITPTITPVDSTDTNDSLVFVFQGADDRDMDFNAGGDADYTLEDADQSADAGGSNCGAAIQTRSEATPAVPPQCDYTLLNIEQWRATWFAVRSIAPTAAVSPVIPFMVPE